MRSATVATALSREAAEIESRFQALDRVHELIHQGEELILPDDARGPRVVLGEIRHAFTTRGARIMPAFASSRAVPLIAPRLACSASAMSPAVCSGGSQISNHPHIRPAIGVIP